VLSFAWVRHKLWTQGLGTAESSDSSRGIRRPHVQRRPTIFSLEKGVGCRIYGQDQLDTNGLRKLKVVLGFQLACKPENLLRYGPTISKILKQWPDCLAARFAFGNWG